MAWSYTALTDRSVAKFAEIISDNGFVFINGNASSQKTLNIVASGFTPTSWQWSKKDSNGEFIPIQGATSATYVVQGISNIGTYKGSAFDGNEELSDYVTIDAVSDGTSGSSPYLFSVSNENFSISTDNSLKPTSALNYDIAITGYHGSALMTPVAPNATLASGQYKVACSSNLFVLQNDNKTLRFTTNTSTALASANQTFTVTVSYYNDSTSSVQTEEKIITVSASKNGVDGISPTVIQGTGSVTITDASGNTGTVSDGHSPSVTASKSNGVTSVKVDGTQIATINDGAKGENAIVMTSASTPSGTYNGQVGIWQGQIYIWNGTQWENQTNILPTDAVLHYSFDEVPDFPDGTAYASFLNNNTYDIQSMGGRFRDYRNAEISNANGNVLITASADSSGASGVFIQGSYVTGQIIKIKINVTALNGTLEISNGKGTSGQVIATYTTLGTYEFNLIINSSAQYPNLYIATKNANESFTAEVLAIYIGNGSYNTPIIDNANGEWNSESQSGITVQGVSGKGVKCYNNTNIFIGKYFLTDDFTISIWIKPDNNTTGLNGECLFLYGHFVLRNGWVNNNKLVLYLYGANGSTLIDAGQISDILPANIWSHIVITKSNLTVRAYVNGVGVRTFNVASSELQRPSTGYFQISSKSNTRTQSYDDLLIFDRALSEKEVLALYYNKANTPKYYGASDYIVEGVDDDGLVSPSEKQVLYQKWIDIYAVLNGTTITKTSTTQGGEYGKMIARANTAGVSLEIGEGSAFVSATEALRAGLWTTANLANMSVQTKVTAGSIDTLFNNYRTAYEALSIAIDVQNKATASALSISQSNSYHQIPTDSGGSALSYVGTDDIIYILEGESKLDCVSASTTLTAGKWKITGITYTNCSGATTYTISDKGAVIGNLTGISADSAKRTFSISFMGRNASTAESITVVQSFAKSKAGADGSSYKLIASSYCVKSGTTVTFNAQKITGDSVSNFKGYLYKNTGGSWTKKGQFINGTVYASLSESVSSNTDYRLCKTDSATDFVDELSVKLYQDGHSPTVTAERSGTSVAIKVDGVTQATVDDGTQGSRAPRYLGSVAQSNPTTTNPTFSGVTTINGDWYLNTSDGKVYLRTANNAWSAQSTTTPNQYHLACINDMVSLLGTTTNATVKSNLETICNAYVERLLVGTAFVKKLFTSNIEITTANDNGVIKTSNFTQSIESLVSDTVKIPTKGFQMWANSDTGTNYSEIDATRMKALEIFVKDIIAYQLKCKSISVSGGSDQSTIHGIIFNSITNSSNKTYEQVITDCVTDEYGGFVARSESNPSNKTRYGYERIEGLSYINSDGSDIYLGTTSNRKKLLSEKDIWIE